MSAAVKSAVAMRAVGLRLAPDAEPIDLELPGGRIVGIAGLEGHGQQRLLEVLSGQLRPLAGTVEVDGEPLPGGAPRSLRDAFERGIVYVPRDRKTQGIFPALSVLENFAVATLRDGSRLGVLNPREIRRRYEEFAGRLGIVAADASAPIRSLSGGNQQKVLLARWLAARPRVLLLNDPSRGVDHGTKRSLAELYRQVADNGAAVVLLSTEIEELLAVVDEIVVFREMSVSGRLSGEERTRDRVLAAMFGARDE